MRKIVTAVSASPEKFQQVLKEYIPEKAVPYCLELWLNYPFNFKIKKSRRSKLGDYKYNLKDKSHSISVNNDLNKYSFLITYLHEVAHLLTYMEYGRKVRPHGVEWKNNFKRLSLPMLTDEVFPAEVLRVLANYLKNPKASSCSDHNLYKMLSQFDDESKLFLSELESGAQFTLGTRIFLKQHLRRTRYICQEVKTGRKYLISKSAQVKVA